MWEYIRNIILIDMMANSCYIIVYDVLHVKINFDASKLLVILMSNLTEVSGNSV